MVDDKLNRRDYDDEELIEQLVDLNNYLNDSTVWVTMDMGYYAACNNDYDSD